MEKTREARRFPVSSASALAVPMSGLSGEAQPVPGPTGSAQMRAGSALRWDWRSVDGDDYVGPVLDQGACASGLCFDTCATIEGSVRAKRRKPELQIDLSEAFLLSCGGGDCRVGLGSLTSGLEFARTTGIVDEGCMPYQVPPPDCEAGRCSDWQSRLTRILSYASHQSMPERKHAIVRYGPVLGAIKVFDDLFGYTGGVYTKSPGSQDCGVTSVCVVGYDDVDSCWIVKKSWSSNWGEGGFCRIAYGQQELGIDTAWPFYSVDPDVPAWSGSGEASHLVVERHLEGGARLWVYAGDGWRSRVVDAAELRGLVHELFAADRVRAWWDGQTITRVQARPTPV